MKARETSKQKAQNAPLLTPAAKEPWTSMRIEAASANIANGSGLMHILACTFVYQANASTKYEACLNLSGHTKLRAN